MLTAIVANLELVALHATNPETDTLIAETLQAVEVSATINRRLLNCVGKPSHSPVEFSPGECLSEIFRLLKRTLNENIHTTIKVDPDLWDIFSDPGEIQSAVINLILNAQDAMPNGGNLTMELHNKELTASDAEINVDAKPGKYVGVIVSDTGTGMTVDVMQNALEAFFTTKQGKGSGLGLNSVHEFVTKSGGFLDINSVVGKGTTVKFYLPSARSDAFNPDKPITK